MADTEIVEVLLKLSNPDIFDKLEKLKNNKTVLDIGIKDNGKLTEILSLAGKQIKVDVVSNDASALRSLQNIKDTLKDISSLKTISLNLGGNVIADLEKVNNLMGQIQAKSLLPQLSQLGAVQNNNVKTLPSTAFQPGGALDQARALQAIQAEGARQLQNLKAQSVNPQRAAGTTPLGTLDQFTSSSNRFVPINGGSVDNRDLITIERQRRRALQDAQEAQFRAEAAAQAARQQEELKRAQNIAAYNQAIAPSSSLAQRQANQAAQANAVIAFGQAGAPFSLLSQSPAAQQAAGIAAFRSSVGTIPQGKFSPIGQGEVIKKQREELFKELGLSLIGEGNPLVAGGKVLGGIAGQLGGPGGTLLGAQVGGLVTERAVQTFEGLTEVLKKAAEAGLAYRESILSITAVYQATTQVTDSKGNALGISDQLQFQQRRGEQTQLLARKELAPLGITGDKEASLVRAIIAGAAQRGIQFSPEQITKLAARFGGAIQVQRPDLFNNFSLITRDIEDYFSQPGRNTVFKSVVGGFTPGAKNASNAEDFLKATKQLDVFPTALRDSSLQNPGQALKGLNGAVDIALTTFGDSLIRGFVGPINKATALLNDPKFQTAISGPGVTRFSEALGELGLGLLRVTKEVAVLTASVLKGLAPALEVVNKELAKANKPFAQTLKEVAGDPNFNGLRAARGLGPSVGSPDRKAEITPLINKLVKGGNLVENPPETNLKTVLGALGIEGGSFEGLSKIDGFEAAELLKSEDFANIAGKLIGKNPSDGFKTRGSLLQLGKASINNRLEGLNSQFNREDVGENLQFLRQRSGLLGERVQSSQAIVDNAAKEKDRLQKIFNESQTADARAGNLGQLIKATADLRRAERELATARLEGRKATLDATDAAKRLRDAFASATDTGTFKGQVQSVQESRQGALRDLGDAAAQRRGGLISQEEFELRTKQANTKLAQADRAKELLPVLGAEGANNATIASQKLGTFAQEAAEKTKAYGDALSGATRALDNFKDDLQLRKLGAKGAQIAAAEAVAAAGGTITGLGVDQDLVKGSGFFSEESRARFERKVAEENLRVANRNVDQLGEVDKEQQNKLEENKGQAERSKSLLPFELQGDKLSRIRKYIESRQFLGEKTDPKVIQQLIDSEDPQPIQGPSNSTGGYTAGGLSPVFGGVTLPPAIQKYLKAMGVKVNINDGFDPDKSHPRGYDATSTSDDVRGGYNPSDKQINLYKGAIKGGPEELLTVLLHEAGHAIDFTAGEDPSLPYGYKAKLSSTKLFTEAYKKDLASKKGEMGSYFKSEKNGGSQDNDRDAQEEAFAELVRDIIRGSGDEVDGFKNSKEAATKLLVDTLGTKEIGPFPAYPQLIGGPTGVELTGGLFDKAPTKAQQYKEFIEKNKLKQAGLIPNISDVGGGANTDIYSGIVGGLLDSNIDNIRPNAPKLQGGINMSSEEAQKKDEATTKVIDAIKDGFSKLEGNIRRGIESSFGS